MFSRKEVVIRRINHRFNLPQVKNQVPVSHQRRISSLFHSQLSVSRSHSSNFSSIFRSVPFSTFHFHSFFIIASCGGKFFFIPAFSSSSVFISYQLSLTELVLTPPRFSSCAAGCAGSLTGPQQQSVVLLNGCSFRRIKLPLLPDASILAFSCL